MKKYDKHPCGNCGKIFLRRIFPTTKSPECCSHRCARILYLKKQRGELVNLNEYQNAAEETAVYPHRYEFEGLMYLGLGLAGEAGEVADNIKKAFRDDNEDLTPARLENIKLELGDVLWYVAELARVMGWTLEEVARANTDKLRSRKSRGVLGGSGDKR